MSKYKLMPEAFKALYESLIYVSFSWWSPESRHVHFLGETTLPSTRVYSIRTQQTGIVHNLWVISVLNNTKCGSSTFQPKISHTKPRSFPQFLSCHLHCGDDQVSSPSSPVCWTTLMHCFKYSWPYSLILIIAIGTSLSPASTTCQHKLTCQTPTLVAHTSHFCLRTSLSMQQETPAGTTTHWCMLNSEALEN